MVHSDPTIPKEAPAPTRRRIVPTPVVATTTPASTLVAPPTLVPPTLASAPVECPTPVPHTQASAPVKCTDDETSACVSINEGVRAALDKLDAATSALSDSHLLPDEEGLADVERSVCNVRAVVAKARADAIEKARAATEQRARLAATLLPVKIDRTEATTPIYKRHRRALAGSKRNLYMCPSGNCNGVCTQGLAARPFHPSVRKDVLAHIQRWHIAPDEILRTESRRAGFWDEGGAEEYRAKASGNRAAKARAKATR